MTYVPSSRPRPATGAVVMGAVAALLGALATPLPAAADHTPAPTTAVLVGSLQAELGCEQDWQPDCEATALERVGDTTAYAAELDVPAGSHEVKVALGGGWDEDYGAGGVRGGANIPLVLEGPARLRFSYDHTTHLLAFAPAADPAPVGPSDADLVPASLREPLTRERFYFVMADRFANGDTSNDTGGSSSADPLVHGDDPTHKGFYHGGDLAGLLDRLDYIEGLGTTAIWLTPSFANKPVQGAPGQESAGYHGYWVTDFTRIDPHLGTNEELERLVDAAHDRGMKVFFDIITNHTADVLDYPADAYDANGSVPYVSKAAEPYRDADGTPFDDRDHASGPDFPEVDLGSFPYTPTFRDEADRDAKTPDWLNDPTLYHNRGTSTFAGEDSEYGDFPSGPYSALDDLWTEHPDVVQGMVDIYSTWVEEAGIDGFRIDTVKHVNMEFWQQFGPALQDAAADVDNDDFFMFGEIYDADPRFMSQYTTRGRLQAAVDFGFQARGTDFAKGGETTGLRSFYAGDDWYTDTDSNAYQLPTFLGNHDMGRVGSFLRQAFPDASDAELLQRDRLAHDLMYLTRGQPVVYYGDEQGFSTAGEANGSIGDQDAREDMFPSQVDSYNDNDLIGTDATTAQENYDPSHPLYQHVSALADLRDEHSALADGTQVHRYASNGPGVYAFSRIDREDQVEYLVALNNSDQPRTVTVPTYSARMPFRSVLGETGVHRTDAEGRVDLTVPALGTVVMEAARPLTGRRDAPSVSFVTPATGGVVGGGSGASQDRAELRVAVGENAFAEVGFAWRPVGTEDWRRLGTDDNAPYRVFHDVSGLADGTLVEYRAVLRDSDGNLAATSSSAVVGDAPTGGGGGPVGPVEQPGAVSVPGSLNSEMGCPADWQPDCAAAQLTLDTDDGIWKGTFTLPAGSYEYKAAIDGSWDENYGAGAARDGSNIPFVHPGGEVTFFYDHRTHWVTNDVSSPVVTAPGSMQSELGCPGDWLPDCMLPWLQDPDGDGVWTHATTSIPAGSYEVKAAHGLSWDESYGAGGVPGGENIAFTVPADGAVTTFSYTLATHLLTVSTSTAGAAPDLMKAKAHWLGRDLVAWPADALPAGLTAEQTRWRLHWAPDGGLAVDAETLTGGDSAPLRYDPQGLPADVAERFPHLAGHLALRLDRATARDAEEILHGQVAVAQYDDLGALTDATGVQVPGVLDDLYGGAAGEDVGPAWRGRVPALALWAPTAQDVDLLLWQDGAAGGEPARVQARRDADGLWNVVGRPTWKNAQYLWAVRVYAPSTGQVEENLVTDPYSVGLTTDSQRSVLLDLDDPALAPQQWRTARPPALAQPEDSTIYELHVRDYSVSDPQVPAEHRGTYLAFADEGQGRAHLRELAEAGLNTVHLLPTFDLATVPEDRSDQATPPCDLAAFAPDSPEQQACIEQVRATDGFNWGYDPWHFSAPEGSYATQPDGGARIAEFRTMVGALHADGLRVVLDQVFNHTHASGQDPKSVLDRVVPGYYHRLNPATGAVETSTCCQNVATEHAMAERLMVDSVLLWARDHKVDGFRFDLMGHHSRSTMEKVRAALDELTVRRDGVDGKGVYLYGEGWDFGEVAGNARFHQAVQGQLDGTGIGTFSDRLRDAVRGGGPFDDDPRIQGLGTGLFTDPNGSPENGTPDEQRARLLHSGDLVKLGMAGNLRDFELVAADGQVRRGDELDYNGSPAGYASEPDEVVTYVDAHDNETLWDALTLKLPADTPMDQRVRMNTVALSTVALSQTPAFWHAGADLLRSKSLDRNSYDSGDWFNHLGWDGADNGFGRGLPPAADNEAKWGYQQPLLADPALKPTAGDVATASAAAQELLELRFSSPLFRLGSAEAIRDRVSFPVGGPEQTPGVVVMRIDDTSGTDLDPALEGLLVVLNATPDAVTQAVPELAGERLALHPVQAGGSDPVVQRTRWRAATGEVTVPGRTVAVLTHP